MSACNPSAVDSSALSHLLFFLCACVCVFVRLGAWEQVYVECAVLALVRTYSCVIGLYEIEKAGAGLHRVGEVVQREMNGGFPRTVFIYCSRPLGKALGEGRCMRAEEMHTSLTLLGSENISRGLP